MSGVISLFMQWVSVHPHLTGLIVGLIACAEALAFIGLLVPGAALMLAAGALVGAGLMEFWSTFAWAVGGAVLGDGVSYWLGHHYRERLRVVAPLRRHPEWLARGEVFFRRHGGKSILFARFVGPVRPVIPVVAGMLGMAPVRFYLYNGLSALMWAPAHLLPGMAVGASLVLAGQVATRLVVVLGVLVVAVWLIVWLVHLSYHRLQPQVSRWATHALAWGHAHPRCIWLVADLLDPARPSARALLVWLALLIGSAWLFLGVLEDVLTRDPLVYAGQAIYHLLQHWRTPLGDEVMVVLTELGDAAVTIPVAAVVLAWLLWRRAWRDALYWLSAMGFGALAVVIIKLALKVPRPVPLYSGAEAYSFPSSHATLSTVIYGLLAVLAAPAFSARWRWLPYATAVLMVIGISFSRLYLGAHWLADVTAGLALGTVWISLLAITRERRQSTPAASRGLVVVALVAFVAAAGWHAHARLEPDLERYAGRYPVVMIDATEWWQKGWRKLPAWRIDLQGEREQPMNVQWAGELVPLRQYLISRGWREPLTLNARTALTWLLPNPTLRQIPVLPQLHNGQYESLSLISAENGKSRPPEQYILRLWSTTLRLQPGDTPVWIGTVASQRLERLPLISFPRLNDGYDQAMAALQSILTGVRADVVQRPSEQDDEGVRWSGRLLLINDGV
jgi:membrane protein DedA with SNARE-associated domain/membrane-associated phospholipid phosphatase